MGDTRYAIYYVPAPGALADFGAAWLGWDPVQGVAVPHPALPGLPVPVDEITATPRKYGLHATLKPPFRLRQGQTEGALAEAVAAFAARTAPVLLEGLSLSRLGRFLALTPEGDTTALNAFAAATVRAFEPFRAPLDAAELARRRKARLSPRQDALTLQWGYPYVMEEFRFHITLSGRLDEDRIGAVEAVLAKALPPLPRPYPIDGLGLLREDDEGRFHLLHRYALTG